MADNKRILTVKSRNYMNKSAISYILNRSFTKNKKFVQFFHPVESFIDRKGYSDSSSNILLTPQKKQLAAQQVYNGTKLLIYNKSSPGKIRELFQIIKSRGFFKVFRRQVVSNVMLNARIGIVLIPALLTYFLTPAPLLLYSLMIIILAVSFAISGIYSAYTEIKNNQKKVIANIQKNFSYEELFFKEQELCQEFETKIGIKELIEYFIENPALLLSSTSFPEHTEKKMLNLLTTIKDDPRISYMTKQIIAALSELHDDPMKKWKKCLSRIDSNEKKSVMKEASPDKLHETIEVKLTEISENLKKEKFKNSEKTVEKEKKGVKRHNLSIKRKRTHHQLQANPSRKMSKKVEEVIESQLPTKIVQNNLYNNKVGGREH